MTSTPGRGHGPGERGAVQLKALMRTLRRWPWFNTFRTLLTRFREDRLGLTAGSLTFMTLIALVPLGTVMLAIFTAFPMFSGFEAALNKFLLQNLVPENIAKPVMRTLTQFTGKARGMGTVGLMILVATALSMVLTIDRTLNAIWRVRRVRPLAQRILVYWAALTLGPLVLGVSLSLTSYALSASQGLVSRLPGAVSLVLEATQFMMLTAAAAGLFHYVPNTTVRWAHAWSGAVFVALGFEVAKKSLAWYVSAVPTFSAVYGAFATLPILLLWIYVSWVIVLLGAVIAAYAPSLLMHAPLAAPVPGWRFELTLAVLHQLEQARRGPERGVTLPELSERLQADPLVLEPAVDLLAAMDWVARLDEGGSPRHVLICDPATTPLAPLVDRTLLARRQQTAAFRERAGIDRMMLVDAIGS